MSDYTISSGFSGLNNKVDPTRLKYDKDTGIGELAEAVNVNIDDTGRIGRRAGQVSLSAVVSHSLFCDKGDAFVVQDRTSDSAIYKIGTDLSLTGIRSGLEKGARISFCQVGDLTYYSSPYQNGVIAAGISSAWPTFTAHVGATTTRAFYGVPLGSHIAHFNGCMWIADGDVVWVSEPYAYGKYDHARRFFQFGSDVRMIKPVFGGVWISDGEQTGFIQGAEKLEAMSWVKKSSFPAHEWSECIELVDLSQSKFQLPGLSAIWASDAGLTIGTSTGELIVATEEKLIYPTGAMGATVADGHNVINTVY